MSTITISEIRPSYLVDLESSEMTAVFGGLIGDIPLGGIGVPNYSTGIVFTPVGGTQANVLQALDLGISYAGRNGFLFEVVHGGSFGFYAVQAAFFGIGDLPSGTNG